jgi:hypothetical protein
MKITKVAVHDPGREGWANAPSLNVYLDEMPRQTSITEYATTSDGQGVFAWRQCGPFTQFLYYGIDKARQGGALGWPDWPDIGLGGAWSSRASVFNVEVVPDAPVVDVTLYVTGPWERTGMAGYALKLDRAKSLLRKYDPDWYMQVDSKMAQRGEIQWTPAELIPSCLYTAKLGGPACLEVAYHPFQGRPLGLCDEHKAITDAKYAALRTKGSTARPYVG